MTITDDLHSKNLRIALFSSALAGTAANDHWPTPSLAERAAEIADEAIKVVTAKWPDAPKDFRVMVFGPRT